MLGALEGSGCDLHSFGLKFDATNGQVTGVPTAEEATTIECVVEAIQNETQGLVANTTLTIHLQPFVYDMNLLSFPATYTPTWPSKTFTWGGVTLTLPPVYSNWRVSCTPDVPWLNIDSSSGILTAGQQQPPEAAFCTITAYNGTDDLSISLPVVYPKHWASMSMQQTIGSNSAKITKCGLKMVDPEEKHWKLVEGSLIVKRRDEKQREEEAGRREE